ncbi:bacteriohemerythrin [Dyella silvae]|uniref:bacteriohemerythrin n=1 Tax=Dyella silvae TaxID=2994424 RepID=UPI002264A84F|nr:bacteriohemerythrin [Dyella silvae]
MGYLSWQGDLDTGIEVIDKQHQRIVSMVNALHEAQRESDQPCVQVVLEDLVDYTLSHFAFEEALMEDAGYPFSDAHRAIHERFVETVKRYQDRARAGEDVAEELKSLLSRWLFQHIRGDDKAYVPVVRRKLQKLTGDTREGGWLATAMRRFFGHRA